MGLQWIVDNAASISFDTRSMVGQSITRDGQVTAVSRGAQPWRFEITPPNGPKWSDYRGLVANTARYDRHTQDTVNFAHTGLEYIFEYKGELTSTATVQASYTAGYAYLNITGGSGATNWRFRAGDIVQLNDYVYMITEDVSTATTQVRIHRPLIESGTATVSGGTLKIGTDCEFRVICSQYPRPSIFSHDQIGWEGSFILTEVID